MDASEAPLTVLYDDGCGLCRRLAEYGHVRAHGALLFRSWQDYVTESEAVERFSEEERAGPPRHLRVLDGELVLEDADAWQAILAAYPPFGSLSWIADRLGFMGTVSRVTYYGGQWLRKRCGSCP